MTTALTIITAALFELGAYQPGEAIKAQDSALGLEKLNDMMDTWSNENLACFANLAQETALITGQADYTIGPDPSADIEGVRPLRIEQMWLTDVRHNNYPVALVTQYDWNQITNRFVNSQTPTTCFYDPQYPLGIIKLWPMPYEVPYTLHWMSYLRLNEFPNLVTEVTLPPGYVSAMKPNLALFLAPFFGMQVQPGTVQNAARTLGSVKRKNYITQNSYFDPELRSRSGGAYNIFTDQTSTRGNNNTV